MLGPCTGSEYAEAKWSLAERTRDCLIPMYDETIVAYQDLRVVLPHQAPRPGMLNRTTAAT